MALSVNDVLGDDMLIEILRRLPCKTVIRSKSVCKFWNSIISDPEFPKGLIALQVGWNGGQEKLIITEFKRVQFIITRRLPDFDLSSLDYLPCFQGKNSLCGCIVSSCNGLLLCSDEDKRKAPYYICNPVTKQWVSIPPSLSLNVRITAFVCDPHFEIDDQGRVVLNPHCRFRIVCQSGSLVGSDPQFDVNVYSSEIGEWRKSSFKRNKNYTAGLEYVGIIILRAITYNNKIHFQEGGSIVVYDPFSDKLCGEIECPMEAIGTKAMLDVFSCSKGFLWAYQYRYWSSTLYMWRVIGQRWRLERQVVTSEHTVSTSVGMESIDWGKWWSVRVITIHPDNPNMVYLGINSLGLIVLWDLEMGTWKNVSKFRSNCYLFWRTTFFLELPLWPYFISNFPISYHTS